MMFMLTDFHDPTKDVDLTREMERGSAQWQMTAQAVIPFPTQMWAKGR